MIASGANPEMSYSSLRNQPCGGSGNLVEAAGPRLFFSLSSVIMLFRIIRQENDPPGFTLAPWMALPWK
jgi:hypothetical protein